MDRPATLDFASVRKELLKTVVLCLDSDPSLVPLSSHATASTANASDRDPDDFTFWSERQAKRISIAIKETFDVEFAPEVIIADANVSALTSRILGSMELLSV